MKKIIVLVITFILVINSPVLANINNLNEFKISEQKTQEIRTNNKIILAITDISNDTGNPSLNYLNEVLANSLATSLVQKLGNSISIVERGKFNAVLKEIQIGQSGYIDINTAKKIGNSLGASQIIIGELIKISEIYRLNIRIIDVNNSVILSAFSEEAGAENDILKMVDKISDKITFSTIGKTIHQEKSLIWIASLFIPGLGQILIGEINRGIWFILGEITAILSNFVIKRITGDSRFFSIPVFLILGVHIWSVVDAYMVSDKKSKLISETNEFEINNNLQFTLYRANF
mgnify:CR=1 FL=1